MSATPNKAPLSKQPPVSVRKTASRKSALPVKPKVDASKLQSRKDVVSSTKANGTQNSSIAVQKSAKSSAHKTESTGTLTEAVVSANTLEPNTQDAENNAQSFTPPGSPVSSPTSKLNIKPTKLPATPFPHPRPRPAAHIRRPTPLLTPGNSRIAILDRNALRTPSKSIVESLDRAIDEKIREDRRAWAGVE